MKWTLCSGQVTNRKFGIEDYILILCGVIIVLVILWFLTACSGSQSQAKFRYSNGCLIELEGITAAQAEVIRKDISFGPDCTAKRSEEEKKGSAEPD